LLRLAALTTIAGCTGSRIHMEGAIGLSTLASEAAPYHNECRASCAADVDGSLPLQIPRRRATLRMCDAKARAGGMSRGRNQTDELSRSGDSIATRRRLHATLVVPQQRQERVERAAERPHARVVRGTRADAAWIAAYEPPACPVCAWAWLLTPKLDASTALCWCRRERIPQGSLGSSLWRRPRNN
jgi:hypothetical protein